MVLCFLPLVIYALFYVNDFILTWNDLEVVVYEGAVREKPSSEAEARQFMKGLVLL